MEQLREGRAALDAQDPERAAELLTQVADRARKAGIPALAASACGVLAQAFFALGERDEALSQARRALAMAEELKQEKAVQHFQGLIQFIESAAVTVGEPESPEWSARIQAALNQAKTGDGDTALKYLVELAEEAHTKGAQAREASARIYLGQILLARGEHAFATAELLCALGIAEELGDERASAHIRALLGQADKPPNQLP